MQKFKTSVHQFISAIVFLIKYNIKYFLLYYFLDTDIAFNKPATASSIFGGVRYKFGPQFVTNGLSVCDNTAGPIAHTQTEVNPWFKVDLQGTFYIKTVVVNPKTRKVLISDILK